MIFVTIEIPGDPQGKGRPRMGRGGNVYTPAATRGYEKRVKALAWEAMRTARLDPLRMTAGLDLVARFPPPAKLAPEVRALTLGEYYRGTPDGDNILKAVKDALNREVYYDDRQVSDERVVRRYVLEGEEPGLTVRVWSLTGEWGQ